MTFEEKFPSLNKKGFIHELNIGISCMAFTEGVINDNCLDKGKVAEVINNTKVDG